jgi:hypothetical protein
VNEERKDIKTPEFRGSEMVFHLIVGLLSILSSSIVYIAGAILFTKEEEMLVAFVLALLSLWLVIFIVRLFFSRGEHSFRNVMRRSGGHAGVKRRAAFLYRRMKERQLISGNIARVVAFSLIVYLFTLQTFMLYVAVVFLVGYGMFSMFSHRHKLGDIISGLILGVAAGYFSFQYAPLLMNALGF